MGANTTTYKRAGAYVTDPVLNETTGQFSANYTPGVSERRAGVSTFLHSGLKNADARTTDGAAVTAERQYDAFGNLTGGNGTWNGPFGYAGAFGYQEDGESGLKLLGHRYYDSTTGRFLSKDPIGDGRNWYSYCDNNPVRAADPSGLIKIAGDTSGWAWGAWFAPGNWGSHNNPSKADAIRLLIDTDDEGVGIWGHGAGGSISVNGTESLNTDDMVYISAERKKRGKKKFKRIIVNQCDVMSYGPMVNACLSMSEEVVGYCGWNNHTPRRSWTQPVSGHYSPTPAGMKEMGSNYQKRVPSDPRGRGPGSPPKVDPPSDYLPIGQLAPRSTGSNQTWY